jgi:hypothetical protein
VKRGLVWGCGRGVEDEGVGVGLGGVW